MRENYAVTPLKKGSFLFTLFYRIKFNLKNMQNFSIRTQLIRLKSLPKIYQTKNSLKSILNFNLNLLTQHGLNPHSNLLQLGCENIDYIIPIILSLEKNRYVLVEKKLSYLNKAYQSIYTHKLAYKNPFFINSDTFGGDELGDRIFDYILLSEHLHKLTTFELKELMCCIRKHLAPHGIFIADIPDRKISLHKKTSETMELVSELTSRFNLNTSCHGRLGKIGYPDSLKNSSNILITIHK